MSDQVAPSAQLLRLLSTACDSQSGLSSGEHVFGRLFLVGTVVAEHGPEHVDASSGEARTAWVCRLPWARLPS